MAEENTSDGKQNTGSSTSDDPKTTTPGQGGSTDDNPKTFTQEEIDRLLAKTRREEKAKYEKQLADASKSETERLQSELAQLKAEKLERDGKDEVVAALAQNGCKRAEAAYLIVKPLLTRDKNGKLENLKEVLAEAKQLAPEFFDESKARPGSADAGAKGGGGTKSAGQMFNDAIRQAAGRKVM